MKILYAYDMSEKDFLPLAIAKYEKLAKTKVGKFAYNKNGVPTLEEAFISLCTVDNLIVAAISLENVGVAIEPKDKKLSKKIGKSVQEFVDYNAFLRWTGKGIIMSVTYKVFPEDKLRRFTIGDYLGSVYSIDGSVSLIEIK